MIRLMLAVMAAYHRVNLVWLRSERDTHIAYGMAVDHPFIRGLDYCIKHHDARLVRLGYNA